MNRISTDEEIIAGLKQRDIRVYEDCIEKYKNYVGAIVVRQIGNTMEKEDIEEAVSDVFFAIWKQADKIKTDNRDNWNLKSYLATISRNIAINKLRQKNRFDTVSFDGNIYSDNNSEDYGERRMYRQNNGEKNDSFGSPEDYIVNKEHMEQIGKAIETLGSPDKEMFIQYHYDGVSINRLSDEYGINSNTIKSKLSRSRYKLKKYFKGIDG